MLAPLLSGCSTLYPTPVDRKPDASLLLDCRAPAAPTEPVTYGQAVLGWVDAIKAFLDCRDEKRALATFVKGGKQ
ncbi:MAG: Rz1-like lysis system protein LysC [Elstera sp.]